MQLGLTSQQLVDCSQDCRPYSHHRGLIQDLPRRRHVARSSKSPISGSAPAAFAPGVSSGHSCNQCYSTTMTQAVPRQRAWLPRYSTISQLSKSLLVALLIAMHAVSPAHAVRIPLTNCLSDAYRLHEPTRLQWVPLYADAVFDTENEKHNLRVIVWGNVTGTRNGSAMPPPGDPSWKDPSDINGKIAVTPQKKDGYNTATTYFPKVHFLTYAPYNTGKFNFCSTSLINGSCPLGPYFGPVDYRYVLVHKQLMN